MAGDLLLKYGTPAAYTITLASLATGSTLLAGRESTAIDNTTTAYTDFLIGGKITTGTNPTVNTYITVWAVGIIDDAPVWPDVFDGTDSAETWSLASIRDNAARRLATIVVTATSDITYWFGPVSLAAAFGGVPPPQHVIFVTHSTAVNLNSTAGNHAIYYWPVYAQYT